MSVSNVTDAEPRAACHISELLSSSVSPKATPNAIMTVSVAGDSSDDEFDWEEVHVPEQQQQSGTPLDLDLASPAPRQNIEITLQARPKKDDTK